MIVESIHDKNVGYWHAGCAKRPLSLYYFFKSRVAQWCTLALYLLHLPLKEGGTNLLLFTHP